MRAETIREPDIKFIAFDKKDKRKSEFYKLFIGNKTITQLNSNDDIVYIRHTIRSHVPELKGNEVRFVIERL